MLQAGLWKTVLPPSLAGLNDAISSWLFPAIEDLLQSGFVPRCDLLTRQTQDPCIAKPRPGASGRQHLLCRFRDAGQNVLQERIREGDLRVYQGEEGLHLLPHIYEGSCDFIFQVFYRLGSIAIPKCLLTCGSEECLLGTEAPLLDGSTNFVSKCRRGIPKIT
jgi:hypothetical protein